MARRSAGRSKQAHEARGGARDLQVVPSGAIGGRADVQPQLFCPCSEGGHHKRSERTKGLDAGPIGSGQSRGASSGSAVGTGSLARARKSERINQSSHHTHISLVRWRPTWRVLNPIGCCEYVLRWRRACHLVGRERNRRPITTLLKCDASFPRVRIGLLLIHLAIIISQGRPKSGSPPSNSRASSSSSPEHHQDWSVRHHVHACFPCFLQGIKPA